MDTKKRKSLEELYRSMSEREITARLISKQLAPLAEELARAELANRAAQISEVGMPTNHGRKRDVSTFGAMLMGILLLAGLSLFTLACYLILSPGYFYLVVALVVLPTLAAYIGKVFPKLGVLVGSILLFTPFWFAPWIYKSYSSGGKDVELALILSAIFTVFVAVPIAGFGGFLIKGALHRGGWQALEKELAVTRDEAAERIKSL